ncbi:MAG: hypothetical protein GX370_03210 [Clostridia bacterium]|nr:hypothetical protein [Clostridia bacterium]
MKYKISSFIVIICSIVCAYIMLSSSNDMASYDQNIETELLEQANSREGDGLEEKNNLEEEKEESKDNKEKKVEEEKNKEEEYPESTAVFKVQSSEIIDKLTISEKTKLLALRQKISPVDYAKINNYLLDENSTRGIIKTFALLKARLSQEDYDKIKDIASKYIDVDCVEDYIEQ